MIFRSPFPDVEIPDVSLTDYVLRRSAELAEKPAFIEGTTGRVLTYGELARSVRNVAANLARLGIVKADVVALYSCNVPEYAIAFYAATTLGAIVTTANPLSTAEELGRQLADSGARVVFAAPELVARAREGAAGLDLVDVFSFGTAEGATPFDTLLEPAGEPPHVEIDPAVDLAALPYSSGTTGLPKGVMLTHRNLVGNLCQYEICSSATETDTLMCVLPMFHIYGMSVILNGGLSVGATIVTMPRFELEQFLHVLSTYRVTIAYVVPPIVLALAKHPSVDKYDLSRLRVVFSGAAPLGAELTTACSERLGCLTMQGYGMTETSPVTHTLLEDPAWQRAGSIGPLIPNTECRLVSPTTGEDVGVDEEGELLIRGPQVMAGYLNNPEATVATIDAEGWLHTGDIGVVDERGVFMIVDRVKELIKFKGFQVAPAELEGLLLAHPAVADAAVVPRADAEAGEVPVAFVVARGDVTAEELMDSVARQVAPYKKIRSVEFIDRIPKSASGKILRRILRDRVEAASARG